MKRYEAYKPSGTAWFTSVPEPWNILKINALFSQRKEKVSDKDFAPISVTKNGIMPQLETAAKTDDGDNRKKVCVGDFVINSRSDRKGSCGVSPFDGSVSLINIVLQPRQELNGRYAHYLLRSQPFSEEFYRNGRGIVADLWTTRYSEMKNILLPVPPRNEQDQIVRYLDWQVSKINRLIAAKRKQIELLSEEKQNIINAAVLHGVNDRCEKRTSPILFADWIPSHWRVLRGKYLFAEHDRRTETGNEVLLSVSHITGVTPRSEKNITMFQAESLVGYKICSVDDIAANTMWMWQGAIAVSDYYGVISPSYNTYHQIGNHYNRKYLDYLLRSNVMVNEYKAKSTGIRKSRLRLYPEQFLSMSFPIPPMDEQLEIVKYIEAKIQRIEVMVSTIHAEIQKIQDLRARLISDVVTGQIDVRGIEVPTFEYIDESNNNDENTEEMEAELDG